MDKDNKELGTHSYNIEDAKKYGLASAVILYNLRFWIKHNKANRKNCHDGRYWTYNTTKAFSELLPELSEKQIKYSLKNLKTDGIILVEQFNKINWDHTNWYSINEDWTEEFADEGEDIINMTKLSDRSDKIVPSMVKNCPITSEKLSDHKAKIVRSSSTDINTDINTNINLESSEQTKEVCSSEKAEQKIIIDIDGNEEVNNIILGLSPKTQEAIINLYNDTEFIKREFIKMSVWLAENKKKAPKSNYTRFVMNWLDRGWEAYRKTISSRPAKRNFAQENADRIKNMKNPYDI